MHSETGKHMTKIILDGLKDAEMQLGYAHEAKEEGDTESMRLFRDEAQRRLDLAQEWYEKMHHEHNGEINEGAYRAMVCHFKEWYHSMRDRLKSMHE